MIAFTWFYWLLGRLSLVYFAFAPLDFVRAHHVQSQFRFYRNRGMADIAFRIADLMTDREPNEDYYYYLRAVMFCDNGQFEDGFDDISEALNIAPREVEYWLFRAKIYKYLERHEEAIADLKQSILYARDQQAAIQWFEIAMNYMKLMRYEDAVQAFSESVKQEEVAIPLYYYRYAQALDRLLDREQAKHFLQKSVLLNFQVEQEIVENKETVYDRSKYTVDEMSEILAEVYELGLYVPTLCRYLYYEQNHEECLVLIERALQILPNHQMLLVEHGKSLRSLDRVEDAMHSFQQALTLDADVAEVYVERAHTFRAMGDEEAALQDFLRAQKLDEHLPYLYYWIAGSYVTLDQLEDALIMFNKAIEEDDHDINCYFERAEVYESLGLTEEAERDYDQAITVADSEETRMKRGLFYWRQDRSDDALIDLQKALEHDDELLDNHEFLYVRAMLFMDIENYPLADSDLNRLIELDSENEVIYERRARCRVKMGLIDQALEDCNTGLTLNPDFIPLLWARGFLLFQLSDYRGAARDALDYLRLNPEDASAHFNLALIYMNLYEYKNALAQFSLTIARDPYHIEAYYQRAHVWEKLLDFDRVAKDLANWAFYDRTDLSYEKRVEQLQALDSFDEMIIEDAIVQLQKLYGQQGPSLLH
jgi:tetratricopeptide (TPR) repeat protein